MSVCLSLYLSVSSWRGRERHYATAQVPVCLSVSMSVCLSLCLSLYLSVSSWRGRERHYATAQVPVCLSVCLDVCLSVSIPVCLKLEGERETLRHCPGTCLSVCLSVCLYVCLSVSIPVCLKLEGERETLRHCPGTCLSVCLYTCLSQAGGGERDTTPLPRYLSVCLSVSIPVCLKLEGERETLRHCPGAVVLRVPVLFGEVESVAESAVTSLWQKVAEATESCTLDHCQQRFPTDARDVAAVCRKLSERDRQDPSIRGIFHFSAKEQMTKYEMAVSIAEAFNLPSSHLIPLTEQLAASALRPINSQLNCSRLELLNLSVTPRPFTSAIIDCLWPFTPDKRWRQTVFH
ncbi:methionine adenosyltransferase 2 subunit beta isoform X1 [Centropristis striata]|uniref:methionine adenosyltransferase 2 subunit beta isoform X1 n=1 Tax=Centropristis striata TaxID=184440 RepID=UPI0027E02E3D|nr:methionine adenosyltransferase 2 subunit beta isoform X1 [Centropristis striata]